MSDTTCLLPIGLTFQEKAAIQTRIAELLRNGRHLEASTLRAVYFPWA
jgi:hypothetical protein